MAQSMDDNPEVKVSPDGDPEVGVSPDGDPEVSVKDYMYITYRERRLTPKGEEYYRSSRDKFERVFARAWKAF